MSGFGILQRTAHLGNVFLNEVCEYGIYVAQVDQMLSGKVKLSIIVFFESQLYWCGVELVINIF